MKNFKSMLALLVVCAMLFSALPAMAETETAADTAVDTDEMTVLRPFVLTAGFSGENEINSYELAEDVEFQYWNCESGMFETCELDEANIIGTYTALYDCDDDGLADLIQSVPAGCADEIWDSEMAWLEGAGDAEPGTDDETGFAVFGAENVIPYGERLLTCFGIEDWSAPVDFANYENSPYWTDNDYFHALSSDTLTILPGYKTTLQPTGWTCGLSSMLSALEWYGLRSGMNCFDLANLRGMDKWAAGTPIDTLENALSDLYVMGFIPSYSYEASQPGSYELYDPAWVQGHLAAGHPIMVMWNSFGWHWQTIIGYDNMGTEGTNDDVLILMDPYDTTDHNANGYELESYERLIYGVCLDPEGGDAMNTQFFVFWPEDFEYEQQMGEGIARDAANCTGVYTDENKLDYGTTAEDLQALYPDTPYLGENGLAGAATGGYERSGDHMDSPYWVNLDFYNLESSDTLHMLTNFRTVQQATEWTCGTASARMVLNWFDMLNGETDVTLASHRQEGAVGATYLEGMKEVFTYMNDTYGTDFVWVCTDDLDDADGEESYIGDYCLQAGTAEYWYGLIPYLLDNGIPVMIGSDEWGGHWQVIIGYDDMGTVDRTEDDVIILADPYDTTDHNQDGYVIDGFERLVFGWYSSFEPMYKHNDFIAAFPASLCPEVVDALIG